MLSKKKLVQKNLIPKKTIVFEKHFQKKFGSEIFFGPKLFLGSFDYRTYKKKIQKRFGPKKLLVKKMFLVEQYFLVQKNFWSKKFETDRN